MTLSHSLKFTPSIPPHIAIAAPVSPAMSAWLSLVGIPKYQAPTAHITIAAIAADSAMSAAPLSFPKFTMFFIVIATFELISVITRTPKKLHTAAITIAFPTSIHLVETHVAIALGASVHPFTKITPSVSTTDIKSAGSALIC